MIEKKTVFIIGAGASHEIGFPLGTALCEKIRDKCLPLSSEITYDNFYKRLNESIYQRLHEERSKEEIRQALERIKTNVCVPASLDEYLYTNDSEVNISICKDLVVEIISENESHSDHEHHDSKYYNSYYPKLWRLLITGITQNNITNIFKNVSLIIFNYDRSLENYIYEKLKYFEFLDEQSRKDIMRSLYIHHPYGQIGKLPWQQNPENETVLKYGTNINKSFSAKLISQIRTYREEISDSKSVEESRRRLKEAEQIVFLGFGFHKQNMELLSYKRENYVAQQIFATTKGKIPNNTYEREQIYKKMCNALDFEGCRNPDGSLVNFHHSESCSALFDEFETGIL